MAHKDLAGKIDALAAVLEPTIGNATEKDSAFPAARATQAVAAAATGAVLIFVADATISATDSRQTPSVTIVLFHTLDPRYPETLREPSLIG
jgi:hypothetical protein